VKGRIIRGVGGFYYVYTDEGIYECRARGSFRKEGIKPLVGDDVEISVTSQTDMEGSLDEICERRSVLIRPAVANVDQALVFFACASPEPNLNLLDHFLAYMQQQKLETILCFNKTDLADEAVVRHLREVYAGSGCPILSVSLLRGEGLEELDRYLDGRTTVVAGPSGAGKSSLTNYLQPQAAMEVGEVSRKIGRGRQTTRHTQLVRIRKDTYFLDTPGFSSLELDMPPGELPECYPEFRPYIPKCYFDDCLHHREPDCAVKQAVERGEINRERYGNYLLLLEELSSRRRY